MDEKTIAIVDAAIEVAHFSKTHEFPKEGSPEFFEFAQKLDVLATAITARFPAFQRNVQNGVIIARLKSLPVNGLTPRPAPPPSLPTGARLVWDEIERNEATQAEKKPGPTDGTY